MSAISSNEGEGEVEDEDATDEEADLDTEFDDSEIQDLAENEPMNIDTEDLPAPTLSRRQQKSVLRFVALCKIVSLPLQSIKIL